MIRGSTIAALLATLGGCVSEPAPPAIQTLKPGVLTVAITGKATDGLDPEAWMYRYAERLTSDLGLLL